MEILFSIQLSTRQRLVSTKSKKPSLEYKNEIMAANSDSFETLMISKITTLDSLIPFLI